MIAAHICSVGSYSKAIFKFRLHFSGPHGGLCMSLINTIHKSFTQSIDTLRIHQTTMQDTRKRKNDCKILIEIPRCLEYQSPSWKKFHSHEKNSKYVASHIYYS